MDTTRTYFNSFLYSKLFIAFAILFSIAVTVVVYLQLQKEQQQSFELRLDKTVTNYAVAFSLKIKSDIKELRNVVRFYNSTNLLRVDEFLAYIKFGFKKNSSIRAIEWVPKISFDELKQHELKNRNTNTDYFVWQRDRQNQKQRVTQRSFYFPVMYIHPLLGNESALGFDLASDKKRGQALMLARDSGRPVATQSLTLVQTKPLNTFGNTVSTKPNVNSTVKNSRVAFLLFIPHYKIEGRSASAEQISSWTVLQRQQYLNGFITGVFNVAELFETAIQYLPSSGLDISIVDTTEQQSQQLLYQHRSRLADNNDINKSDLVDDLYLVIREFNIAERIWALQFRPVAQYFDQFEHQNATLFLITGLLMSLLLFAYLLTLRFRMLANLAQIKKSNTELINSDIRQHTIIETIADALIVINEHGIIEAFNPAASGLFGYSESEIVGENVKILMPENSKAKHNHYLQQFAQTGNKKIIDIGREVIGVHKNGATIHLFLTVKEMLLQGELKYTGVLRDISKQKDYENEILIAKELAEAGIKIKDNFMTTMSHEIRTPMNGVLGMVQFLQDSKLSDEQREYVDVLSNSSQTLLAIINDILDFSTIESGNLKLEPVVFNLEQLIFNVVQLLARKMPQNAIQFIFNYSLECPKTVLGDSVRIRQIVMNLVANAIKFTNEGHIYIVVKQVFKVNSECTLRIEVHDTGVGIETTALPTLFDSFTQADSSITRHYGGTGLGLAICKQLVKLMAGAIGVDSVPGEGSSFWISLTLSEQQNNQSNRFELNENDLFENIRVLLVDSYDFSRSQLETQLAAFGVIVHSVADSDLVLNELNQTPYNAIILDHSIGESRVVQITDTIRNSRQFESLGILVLGATQNTDDTEHYRTVGVDAYFAKPILNAVLYHALHGVLDKNNTGGHSIITEQSLFAATDYSETPQFTVEATVLIIDDNDVNIQIISTMLSKIGIRSDFVVDGKQAVQQWQEKKYDLLLMDCQMPIMDGYTATSEIRKIEQQRLKKRIPIIALTATELHGDSEKRFTAGMDDFLSKPVATDALQKKMQQWLLLPDKPQPESATTESTVLRSLSSQPTIDFSKFELLQELMGDAITELVESYVSTSFEKLTKLQYALDSMDSDELHHIAHALKGSSGNLGALYMMELSGKIEQLAKQGQIDAIAVIIDELVAVFAETRKQLNSAVAP